MTVNRPKRGRAIFCALILLLAMGTGRLAQPKEARSPDNAYLDALQGDWDMTGPYSASRLSTTLMASAFCVADFCVCT